MLPPCEKADGSKKNESLSVLSLHLEKEEITGFNLLGLGMLTSGSMVVTKTAVMLTGTFLCFELLGGNPIEAKMF